VPGVGDHIVTHCQPVAADAEPAWPDVVLRLANVDDQ